MYLFNGISFIPFSASVHFLSILKDTSVKAGLSPYTSVLSIKKYNSHPLGHPFLSFASYLRTLFK